MKLDLLDITPCMKVANEEYWIYYVLRDVMRLFGRFIILDTGSVDRTKQIIIETAKETNCRLTLIEANYGHNADKIGNSPNILREKCPTHWMFLVDGDEIWREEQLRALEGADVTGRDVLMVEGRNIADVSGVLRRRDNFNADRLFSPNVQWNMRTDYPFESHGLEHRLREGTVAYLATYFWHARHLKRSSKDDVTYFRTEKKNYFPYEGEYGDLPPNWFGTLGPYDNPYVGKA